jgi:hypothetical protein
MICAFCQTEIPAIDGQAVFFCETDKIICVECVIKSQEDDNQVAFFCPFCQKPANRQSRVVLPDPWRRKNRLPGSKKKKGD